MVFKTRGLVLRFIRYRETSIIVSIYTEAFGIQSYLVNSVRSARSKKTKIALYQPLTLLDLVVYHREKSQLQRISEAKCAYPFVSIPLDHKKAAISLFLVEVLSKTLKVQMENQSLFEFLWESVKYFDRDPVVVENFHLIFLQRLSHYLGFGAHNVAEIEGQIRSMPGAPTLDSQESKILEFVLKADYMANIEMTHSQRQHLLQALLYFYRWHVEQFGIIKSLPVLNQVFS